MAANVLWRHRARKQACFRATPRVSIAATGSPLRAACGDGLHTSHNVLKCKHLAKPTVAEATTRLPVLAEAATTSTPMSRSQVAASGQQGPHWRSGRGRSDWCEAATGPGSRRMLAGSVWTRRSASGADCRSPHKSGRGSSDDRDAWSWGCALLVSALMRRLLCVSAPAGAGAGAPARVGRAVQSSSPALALIIGAGLAATLPITSSIPIPDK
jgi:hypothetical protein